MFRRCINHNVIITACLCTLVQVLERAMFAWSNAYNVPVSRVTGRVCKTNLPSNTAFRGFGGPQGIMMGEEMIEKIALSLGVSPVKVRRTCISQADSQYSECVGFTISVRTVFVDLRFAN